MAVSHGTMHTCSKSIRGWLRKRLPSLHVGVGEVPVNDFQHVLSERPFSQFYQTNIIANMPEFLPFVGFRILEEIAVRPKASTAVLLRAEQ